MSKPAHLEEIKTTTSRSEAGSDRVVSLDRVKAKERRLNATETIWVVPSLTHHIPAQDHSQSSFVAEKKHAITAALEEAYRK